MFDFIEFVNAEGTSEIPFASWCAFFGAFKFFAPIALLALIWGHRGLLARFIVLVDRNYISVLCPSYSRRDRLLQWTGSRLPVPLSGRSGTGLNALWKNGYFMCALINSAVPGACSNPHRHWGKPPAHGQALAYKYLGVPPIFTQDDFKKTTCQEERRLLQYLQHIQHAIANLPVQYDLDYVPQKVKWTSHLTARGMGLVTAEQNRKATFYIYPKINYNVINVSISIRGPYNTVGNASVPTFKRIPTFQNISQMRNEKEAEKRVANHGGTFFLSEYLGFDFTLFANIPMKQEPPCEIPIKVTMEQSRVKVTYVPRNVGIHEICLVSNGCHLQQSPYNVPVEENISGKVDSINDVDFKLKTTAKKYVKAKRVVSKVVDFINEKLILKEDGSFARLSDEEDVVATQVDQTTDVEKERQGSGVKYTNHPKDCYCNETSCDDNFLYVDSSSDLTVDNESSDNNYENVVEVEGNNNNYIAKEETNQKVLVIKNVDGQELRRKENVTNTFQRSDSIFNNIHLYLDVLQVCPNNQNNASLEEIFGDDCERFEGLSSAVPQITFNTAYAQEDHFHPYDSIETIPESSEDSLVLNNPQPSEHSEIEAPDVITSKTTRLHNQNIQKLIARFESKVKTRLSQNATLQLSNFQTQNQTKSPDVIVCHAPYVNGLPLVAVKEEDEKEHSVPEPFPYPVCSEHTVVDQVNGSPNDALNFRHYDEPEFSDGSCDTKSLRNATAFDSKSMFRRRQQYWQKLSWRSLDSLRDTKSCAKLKDDLVETSQSTSLEKFVFKNSRDDDGQSGSSRDVVGEEDNWKPMNIDDRKALLFLRNGTDGRGGGGGTSRNDFDGARLDHRRAYSLDAAIENRRTDCVVNDDEDDVLLTAGYSVKAITKFFESNCSKKGNFIPSTNQTESIECKNTDEKKLATFQKNTTTTSSSIKNLSTFYDEQPPSNNTAEEEEEEEDLLLSTARPPQNVANERKETMDATNENSISSSPTTREENKLSTTSGRKRRFEKAKLYFETLESLSLSALSLNSTTTGSRWSMMTDTRPRRRRSLTENEKKWYPKLGGSLREKFDINGLYEDVFGHDCRNVDVPSKNYAAVDSFASLSDAEEEMKSSDDDADDDDDVGVGPNVDYFKKKIKGKRRRKSVFDVDFMSTVPSPSYWTL